MLERRQHSFGRVGRADAEPRRHQGVGRLEPAGERQADVEAAPIDLKLQPLAFGDQLAIQELQPLPRLAYREHRLARFHRR